MRERERQTGGQTGRQKVRECEILTDLPVARKKKPRQNQRRREVHLFCFVNSET